MIERQLIPDFWLLGINYRNADSAQRGKYAVNAEQYENILKSASEFKIDHLFVLSTCNRTEIYGFGKSPLDLSALLCSYTEGNEHDFLKFAYRKNGYEAIAHLFNVAAGLDSQILGDYEIVGQIKQAVNTSIQYNKAGAFIDRLYRFVLQSSREIRSETKLSSGTVSVAFAAVQYLKARVSELKDKNILVLGSGDIGRNTCKNLVTSIGSKNIFLLNRTEERAVNMAEELGLQFAPYHAIQEYVDLADIIIVATSAPYPILTHEYLKSGKNKELLDLSIPNNIDPSLAKLKGITLSNVDDLSKINDETLRMRKMEIPKAESIISEHIQLFTEWHMMQRNVPVLKALKKKLNDLHQQYPHACRMQNVNYEVQKTLNSVASKLKTSHDRRPGCNYIEAISHYISSSAN